MASELTAAVLAELKRLEKAATRPPWQADHGMNGLPWEIGGPMDDFENAVILADFGQVRRTPRWDDPMLGIPNARLVAALRNHAPALIAAAERADAAEKRVMELEEQVASLRRRMKSERRADDCPVGYEPVQAYTNGKEVVVIGQPEQDDPDHNCDAMGCGQNHVIARTALGKEPSQETLIDFRGLKPDPRTSSGPIEKFAMAIAHRRAEHLEMYAAAYMQVAGGLSADQVSLVEEHLDGGRTGFKWTFEPKEPRP